MIYPSDFFAEVTWTTDSTGGPQLHRCSLLEQEYTAHKQKAKRESAVADEKCSICEQLFINPENKPFFMK